MRSFVVSLLFAASAVMGGANAQDISLKDPNAKYASRSCPLKQHMKHKTAFEADCRCGHNASTSTGLEVCMRPYEVAMNRASNVAEGPSFATLDIRAAIYPGVDPREAARDIEACLSAKSRDDPFLSDNPPEVESNGFFAPGDVLEEGSDAEQVLARAHAASFGSTLDSFVTPGYLDGRVFVLYDDCPCLVYGPLSRDIHAFDGRREIIANRLNPFGNSSGFFRGHPLLRHEAVK